MYFTERINLRLRKQELKSIKKIIRTNKSKYESVAHFIRCAVIKELNNTIKK